MAAEGSVRAGTADGDLEGWRHALRFGSLVGAILGVLTLGALLRTKPASAIAARPPEVEPPRSPAAAPAATAAPVEPPVQAARPPAAPGGGPTTIATDLQGRARADRVRLTRLGNGFTAQLAVLCEERSAQSILDRFARETALYVVPTEVKQRPCYLLSWNHYDTRDAALAAQDLPQGLRAVQPRPFPRPVDEIVR